MSYIQPRSRGQLMMPSLIDDYVSLDNSVRFIDAFVDKVVQIQPELLTDKGRSNIGRSAYQFPTLYKLYIYGFLNSISSSRKLEAETYRNMEVIWLLGNLRPDHKTISDFRKDNKEAIRTVTLDFRKFLKAEGYISGKKVVQDGTKIKAYAGKNTLSLQSINKRMEQLEAQLDKYLTQLQENDVVESVEEQLSTLSEELGVEPALLEKIASLQDRIEKLEADKRMLETSRRKAFSPADPDAKIMKTKEGFMPAYNIQSVVDTKCHMIGMMDVTNDPIDYYLLEDNVKALEEQVDIIPEEVLADKGYANEEQIQKMELNGIQCIVPFPKLGVNQKQIDAGITFQYDEKEDVYRCSQGQILPLATKNVIKNNKHHAMYQGKNCLKCPLKSQCTQSKRGRIIYRRKDNEWLLAYMEKLKTPNYKKGCRERRNYVEHPFGTIKYMMGQIPLLLRGKKKVQVEIDLYATAYNIKRLLNIEPMEVLLQKVAEWG